MKRAVKSIFYMSLLLIACFNVQAAAESDVQKASCLSLEDILISVDFDPLFEGRLIDVLPGTDSLSIDIDQPKLPDVSAEPLREKRPRPTSSRACDGRYQCPRCEKSFTRKNNLNAHVKEKHEGKRFACSLCEKSFIGKNNLYVHIRSAHDKIRFACNECEKSFVGKGSLKRHRQNVHLETRYWCSHCDKNFTDKSYLKVHIQDIHEKIRHQCPGCEKSFSNKGYLNKHIRKLHPVFYARILKR